MKGKRKGGTDVRAEEGAVALEAKETVGGEDEGKGGAEVGRRERGHEGGREGGQRDRVEEERRHVEPSTQRPHQSQRQRSPKRHILSSMSFLLFFMFPLVLFVVTISLGVVVLDRWVPHLRTEASAVGVVEGEEESGDGERSRGRREADEGEDEDREEGEKEGQKVQHDLDQSWRTEPGTERTHREEGQTQVQTSYLPVISYLLGMCCPHRQCNKSNCLLPLISFSFSSSPHRQPHKTHRPCYQQLVSCSLVQVHLALNVFCFLSGFLCCFVLCCFVALLLMREDGK